MALVFLPTGPQWFPIPVDPPERNRSTFQARFALDERGALVGNVVGDLTGAPARRVRLAVGDHMTRRERDRTMSATILGERPVLGMDGVVIHARHDSDKPLVFEARLETKAILLAEEKFRIQPVALVGPAWPGQWRKQRMGPIVLPAPGWIESVAAIELPVGYEARVEPMLKIVEPFAEYAAGFARRNRTLHFSRRLVIKQHVVAPEQWRAFYGFLQRIQAIEQDGVIVWYKE